MSPNCLCVFIRNAYKYTKTDAGGSVSPKGWSVGGPDRRKPAARGEPARLRRSVGVPLLAAVCRDAWKEAPLLLNVGPDSGTLNS